METCKTMSSQRVPPLSPQHYATWKKISPNVFVLHRYTPHSKSSPFCSYADPLRYIKWFFSDFWSNCVKIVLQSMKPIKSG